jgi:uncharacterized protein
MVIYRRSSAEFLDDVDNNTIVEEIKRAFVQQLGWFPVQEVKSWTNSMKFMESIIRKAGVEKDCGVLIEYRIPTTAKRIDFVIAGQDDHQTKNLVIVELKQWDNAQATTMDDVVVTIVNKGLNTVAHPSYQAYSYKTLLTDFNENIETKRITPHSCAYLHNYKQKDPEPLQSKIYEKIVKDSPLFFKHDTEKLQQFILAHVGRGKGMEILYEIESGRIRPSRKLIDHVCSMFKGNKAFTLIDNQKVAFEKALDIAVHAAKKTVLIVKGGPGTGKSVISVNLLGELLKRKCNVVFVAPNAAFRDVMVRSLAKENRLTRLNNLFKGSSSFVDATSNMYDTVVVDEAHRLKNGNAYQYRGDNQVKDVIKAGFTTILFIDECQRVRPDDIGSIAEITRVAKSFKADIQEIELDAQYRCAGAEGFVNWLDDLLQIRETGNFDGWDRKDFEFRIFDDPNVLRRAIKARQRDGFSARMLAGYAWKWTSEGDGNLNGEIDDVVIPQHKFKMPWNSRRARTTWAMDSSGIDQIGCIHTSQGLEFDYVGVIIGSDLEFDSATNSCRASWANYKDSAGKKTMKDDPKGLTQLVKNIYKTLMSRALKGCFVYVCDPGLAEHFSVSLKALDERYAVLAPIRKPRLIDKIEDFVEEHLMFKTHLPVYSIQAACGKFANGESTEPMGWVKVGASLHPTRNMFVVQATGSSMEPKIKDGDYCVFRYPVPGTRQSKIVLVQHHGSADPDYGGSYTIKKYISRKSFGSDGTWEHEEIILEPLNQNCEAIVLAKEGEGEFTVVAEFVGCV